MVRNVVVSSVSFVLFAHIDVIVNEHRIRLDTLVRSNERTEVLKGGKLDPLGRVIGELLKQFY